MIHFQTQSLYWWDHIILEFPHCWLFCGEKNWKDIYTIKTWFSPEDFCTFLEASSLPLCKLSHSHCHGKKYLASWLAIFLFNTEAGNGFEPWLQDLLSKTIKTQIIFCTSHREFFLNNPTKHSQPDKGRWSWRGGSLRREERRWRRRWSAPPASPVSPSDEHNDWTYDILPRRKRICD